MLQELRAQNLLLMEQAELRLGPGLNVLTGETGAGKTLLAHALDLLLGGKARSGIVREGAAEAYVEGVFDLPAELGPELAERIPQDAEELVLARRVWPDGRTRAYVCGRAATVADLRELGSSLLAFYGQHEHHRLMIASAQLDALDGFIGASQLALRAEMAAAHERVRGLETRLEELSGLDGARERELDLLGFELGEIEELDPSEEDERELLAQRERLRHAERLRLAAVSGVEAVVPEEGMGAAALLARAAGELESAAAIDPALAGISERLAAARYELEELAHELTGYADGLEVSPAQLDGVEERLAAYSRLERKHGGGVVEVLAHAERCRARHAELTGAETAAEEVSAELVSARAEQERIGAALSDARAAAAPELAERVVSRLRELSMADAQFTVELRERDGGFGPRGRDAVEFMIAPNAGIHAAPLRDVASGGELSRVMLALLSVAHGPGGERATAAAPLLVFDEIDAGIGGHTARAVGAHLRTLAEGRQVLCITHLPQVAALAQTHFTIVKDGSRTPAVTTVTALSGDGVLAELVRMLGADEDDRAARGHARELLRAA